MIYEGHTDSDPEEMVIIERVEQITRVFKAKA